MEIKKKVVDIARESIRRWDGKSGAVSKNNLIEEIDEEDSKFVPEARRMGYKVAASNLEYY